MERTRYTQIINQKIKVHTEFGGHTIEQMNSIADERNNFTHETYKQRHAHTKDTGRNIQMLS